MSATTIPASLSLALRNAEITAIEAIEYLRKPHIALLHMGYEPLTTTPNDMREIISNVQLERIKAAFDTLIKTTETAFKNPAPKGPTEDTSPVMARVKKSLTRVNDAAHAFEISWQGKHLSNFTAAIVRNDARSHFYKQLKLLGDAIENLFQSLSYPCNKLPPAQVKPQIKPPESLTEGTVLAALFALYATCMRLTNPDDLGHQLQPEARQLINDAIHSVRRACEQPTTKD